MLEQTAMVLTGMTYPIVLLPMERSSPAAGRTDGCGLKLRILQRTLWYYVEVVAGHRLRVYVPYGEQWYAYSVRRLRENPQIAGYAFKAILKKA